MVIIRNTCIQNTDDDDHQKIRFTKVHGQNLILRCHDTILLNVYAIQAENNR